MKVDYSKTIIYKLCCNDINIKDIYVGHSTDFKSRNQDHKKCCNNSNSKKYNQYNYQFIRDNGGWKNWKMIKLYDFPCNSKREAEAEEDKVMRELGATLNSYRAYLSEEEKKEWQKKYNEKRNKDPERIEYNKQKCKERRENNKEKIKEEKKIYRENNKEYINKKSREYYEKTKQKINCEFCNTELLKKNLKTHQKSKSCLKFQECFILDDE